MKKIKEKSSGFGDNLGWLILYLVLLSVCTIPMTMSGAIEAFTNGYGKPIEALERAGNFFNVYGILISFVLMLIMFFVVIKKKKEALLLDVKNFNSNRKKNTLLTIAGFLFLIGFNFLLTDVIRPHLFTSVTTENQANLVSIISKSTPIYSLILYLLLLVIIIPIFEEIFCRFNFRKSFKSTIVFIIVTSLIFGILHMSSFSLSFEFFYDLFIYVFMGVCLAYVYCKTESICSSIIMHILNNLVSVFMLILPFLK